jgi:D-sedoheptulose 7-phosphate isomerase
MIQQHFEDVSAALKNLYLPTGPGGLESIAETLVECWQAGRQVFVIGNGGSAATAQHFVCDLVKGITSKDRPWGINADALNNFSTVTALANDISFEDVYADQYASRAGEFDVLIVFSVSGASPNLVKAMQRAREESGYVIGFFGAMVPTSTVELCNEYCIVKSNSYQVVEDVHNIICHALILQVRNTECPV